MYLFIESGFYNTTKRSILKRLNGFAADLPMASSLAFAAVRANSHKAGERVRFVNRVQLTCVVEFQLRTSWSQSKRCLRRKKVQIQDQEKSSSSRSSRKCLKVKRSTRRKVNNW